MNKIQKVTASPKAQAMANSQSLPRGFTEKYPWRSLEVMQSFTIPTENGTENDKNGSFSTIQNSCYKWSKKLGKKFRAIQHEGLIEVARLPDKVEETKTDFGFEK